MGKREDLQRRLKQEAERQSRTEGKRPHKWTDDNDPREDEEEEKSDYRELNFNRD